MFIGFLLYLYVAIYWTVMATFYSLFLIVVIRIATREQRRQIKMTNRLLIEQLRMQGMPEEKIDDIVQSK